MALVITIGRQYGSGGKDIGMSIAKTLDIPFYDKEIVEMAAQKGNMSKDTAKTVDEKATNSFLYSLISGGYSSSGTSLYYEMPINDKLFIAQSEVIKELARKGSCVIVGRCADYVLRDEKNIELCSAFIYGGLDYRIGRVMERYPELTHAKAKDKVTKTDKQRRTYYDYYTDGNWGVMSNYDVCINTESFGIENSAQMLASYLKNKK
ncbi:MAG: cytidylate kinase-like family protein [Firmicutes bacterium]|nr:cytidylate kinase-like family protein [Bacillota bacterium]